MTTPQTSKEAAISAFNDADVAERAADVAYHRDTPASEKSGERYEAHMAPYRKATDEAYRAMKVAGGRVGA